MHKKNSLYIYCGYPVEGLGNRLTCLCSGYAVAMIKKKKPYFYWETGHGCRAEFDDLFKPIEEIKQLKSPPQMEIPKFWAVDFAGGYRNHLKWLESGLNEEYWRHYRYIAQKIRLNTKIQSRIPRSSGFIAVHIRMHHWPPSRRQIEKLKNMKSDKKIFLSTDSKKIYEELMTDCPNKFWSLSKPTSNEDLGNREIEQQKEALVDMFTLCKADYILTLGKSSSFRNLAVHGYNVPSFKMSDINA